jgi:hypothetical protein
MAVIIPQDYQGKTVEEMYNDLETIAKAYMKQKQTVEDLQGEIKIRDTRVQLMRADILKLKSMIGLQKLELEKVKLKSDDIIDMNHFEIIEEDGKLKRIYNS